MTAFIARILHDHHAPPQLGDGAVSALRLPGAAAAAIHQAPAFICAAARTAAGGESLLVSRGFVVAGDVRLDGRDDVIRALGKGDSGAARRGVESGVRDDLAVVLAAYEAWGTDFVGRLRGDFSFVLWDSARRTVTAARDGLGVRPLYYAESADGLCVSNVLDAIRAVPGVPSTLHAPAVASFLEYGWNRNPATTTFASIARLAPGCELRMCAGRRGLDIARHWRVPSPAPVRFTSDGEYVERFRTLLDDAVRDRITGPTTILLSGGLDSPSIAAAARRAAPPFGIETLTQRISGVEGPDESRLAASVAECLNLPNRLYLTEPAPLAQSAGRTPEPMDEPDLASIRALNRCIAERTPVVLQGEDGDALLAPPGLMAMMRQESPLAVVRDIVAHTVRTGRHPYLGFWLARRLRPWRSTRAPRPAWLRQSAISSPEVSSVQGPHPRADAANRLTNSIWQSVHEAASSAYSGAPLEFRWPLLDTRLMEFVFSIPPIPWCQRKEIMRRSLTGVVPAEVVQRPKTTVPGYFERSVAVWRSRTGATFSPLHEQTAEYVDSKRLADVLRRGDIDEVMGGWRALQFDDWIRAQEAA